MTQRGGPFRIAAVLPLRNKREYVDRCVESMLRAAGRHGAVDIVVVDNGSTDGSTQAPVFRDPRIRLLNLPGVNISAVRNEGAKASTAPILAFVDIDCVVADDFFEVVERVMADPGIDATGYDVRLPADGSWIERVWGAMHTGAADGPRHYLNSACFVVRREIFERVGGFDASLVTGEDTDLCLRLTSAGARIWATRALEVVHLDNPRTLAAFFRKERWRGLNAVTRTILRTRSRTVGLLLFFAAALVVAALVLAAAPVPLAARVLVAVLVVSGVPALAVSYRMAQIRRLVPVAPALLLYTVYYVARLTALAQMTWEAVTRGTSRRPQIG